MKLRPMKPVESRLTAIALVLVVVVLAYFLLLHWWFVAPLREVDSQMADLRDTQSRYAAAIAEKPQLQKRIAELGQNQADSSTFLPETDPNAASASLMQRVVDDAAAHAQDGTCEVSQKMPVSNPKRSARRSVSQSRRQHQSALRYAAAGRIAVHTGKRPAVSVCAGLQRLSQSDDEYAEGRRATGSPVHPGRLYPCRRSRHFFQQRIRREQCAMNAAAQRRMTPVWMAAVVILGVLWLTLLFGMGRGVRWKAPRQTPPLPAIHSVALPSPPPLTSYAQVWEHPLFSADRKPMVSATANSGVSLGDLQLTGIILTPKLHMALLGNIKDAQAGQAVNPANPGNPDGGSDNSPQQIRVREGAMLPDGNWKLVEVRPRSAIFASGSGRTELKLPAGAPIDQRQSNSMNAGPMNAGVPMQPPEGRPGFNRMPPQPMPPPGVQRPDSDAAQRMLKLRAQILKQRAQQSGNAQGEH